MINPMSLEGKCIIITGAASGIGKECSNLCHALGADLLLLDLNKDGLLDMKESLNDGIGSVAIREIDLENLDDIKTTISDAKKELGCSFTGLVHCAGIPSVMPLRALSTEQFERVMRINTEAGLVLAKCFSSNSGHDTDKQGSIVFISSVYGVVGSAANVAYSTSKAAIIGMTKALSIEFVKKSIRVNCVAPGFIKTNMASGVNLLFDNEYAERIEAMHPLGWGEAIDIANAIAFLLSDASKWTTGAVFNVDGGFTAQ
ncbi:MAG: SDR family oxidoreductase [Saccharofermentans sp.]|nr:SDR family oxidoreductase [Saccharofermentans sp.]